MVLIILNWGPELLFVFPLRFNAERALLPHGLGIQHHFIIQSALPISSNFNRLVTDMIRFLWVLLCLDIDSGLQITRFFQRIICVGFHVFEIESAQKQLLYRKLSKFCGLAVGY